MIAIDVLFHRNVPVLYSINVFAQLFFEITQPFIQLFSFGQDLFLELFRVSYQLFVLFLRLFAEIFFHIIDLAFLFAVVLEILE